MTIREFYNSYAWQKQRQYKMHLENYKCANCGGVAEDVHHKIRLTEENVNDANVSMNLDNLECLCRACHNKETHENRDQYTFDNNGNLIIKNS